MENQHSGVFASDGNSISGALYDRIAVRIVARMINSVHKNYYAAHRVPLLACPAVLVF
jgi:hypothetical protein